MAPVAGCDLWGFTLPHELTYTNVLEMLDLAGVPLHAAERGEEDPIVLGGGPAVANPWPVAPFFDAFFIGEVEDRWTRSSRRWARARARAAPRALAAVPGMWVPAGERRARRSARCSPASPSSSPVTAPGGAGARGRARPRRRRGACAAAPPAAASARPACGTGRCASARSTSWSRPPTRLLDETGCDEVSLLSLSSLRLPGVEEALTRIRALRPGLRVSLPSLRIDSAAESLARFAADQRGSVTLAPEAGTQELRDAINKGVDDAQFEEAVRGHLPRAASPASSCTS